MERDVLTPPLTFRLYQSIRFNRAITKDDVVCPGGYALLMKREDGIEEIMQFDFSDNDGWIDAHDPCIVHCIQRNPACDIFEDVKEITEYMLRNIIDVIEWYIFTGDDDTRVAPTPIEIFDIEFEIVGDATGRDISFVKIPMKGFKIPKEEQVED